jgi:hypothetical protein
MVSPPNLEPPSRHAGGCQCGAVRYDFAGPIFNAQICHCRMCQKAFGGYFAPLGALHTTDLCWTRGAPSTFRSSSVSERGFCRDCGTPLTFQYLDEPHEISIALGTLDDPAAVPPLHQYGLESRMPWFATLPGLPAETTAASTPPALLAAIHNLQHPDHDTPQWPKR